MAMKTLTSSASTLDAAQKRDWLRWIGLLLCALGLFVSGYMTYVELTPGAVIACPGGVEGATGAPGAVAVNCEDVQDSPYARLLGIPIAVIGLGGYLAIAAVFLLEGRISLFQDYGRLLVFGMALFGFLFSLYLTYIEFFVIYTVCTWCLTQAAVMTGVFVVATVRLVQYFRAPTA